MKQLLFLLVLTLIACEKAYDMPPLKPATNGPPINIAQVKSKFRTGQQLKFQNDSNLYCVITADETCGNLYHELYVQDATGGLHIGLLGGGGLFTGDSIRILLKGSVLTENNRLITLDSINLETHIVKLASGWPVRALEIPLQELLANPSATNPAQSQLVKINAVSFVPSDRNQLFADAVLRTPMTRTLSTCDGIQLAVRTSGYSLLSGQYTPVGLGSIVGVMSQYGNSFQLLVRSLRDVNMNNPLCAEPVVYLQKDFNDNSLTSGSWSTQTVVANINWAISSSGATSPYAKISNFSSSTSPKNTACETWFISPVLDLTHSTNAVLIFRHAHDFTGKGLEVYASTKYTSGKPQLFDWIRIDSLTGPTGFLFSTASPYPLAAYKSKNVRIAFRYLGSATDGATWEIDDIRVFEK